MKSEQFIGDEGSQVDAFSRKQKIDTPEFRRAIADVDKNPPNVESVHISETVSISNNRVEKAQAQEAPQVTPELEEKLQTVPRSRWGKLLDTIKLHTIDKWDVAMGRKAGETLVNRHKKQIEANAYHRDVAQRRLKEIEQRQVAEAAAFDKAIADVQIPSVREMFVINKQKALAQIEKWKTPHEQTIAGHNEKEQHLQRAIGTFNERVAHVETVYANKIENKIQGIKSEAGYEQELQRNKELRAASAEFKKEIDEEQTKQDSLEKALAYKDRLSAEQYATIKKLYSESRSALDDMYDQYNRDYVQPLELSDAKLSRIQTRIDKWESLKPRSHEPLSESLVASVAPESVTRAHESVAVESESSIEDEVTQEIASAKNFDELVQVIATINGIQGSQAFFESEELQSRIQEVRHGGDINLITSTFQLRDKVNQLLREEQELEAQKMKATADQLKAAIKRDMGSNIKPLNKPLKVAKRAKKVETLKPLDGADAARISAELLQQIHTAVFEDNKLVSPKQWQETAQKIFSQIRALQLADAGNKDLLALTDLFKKVTFAPRGSASNIYAKGASKYNTELIALHDKLYSYVRSLKSKK